MCVLLVVHCFCVCSLFMLFAANSCAAHVVFMLEPVCLALGVLHYHSAPTSPRLHIFLPLPEKKASKQTNTQDSHNIQQAFATQKKREQHKYIKQHKNKGYDSLMAPNTMTPKNNQATRKNQTTHKHPKTTNSNQQPTFTSTTIVTIR